eukprot:TRINITY_DN15992_c0_g1_i1.p1 TRINITY_DN15992_c0_g1~~TRINITY_DN15992_c0_g1_i1.p1  ORF type:complete len:116 (+),score=36.31 TRINITY_DN15992_c0_g1_i1:37-384(+)
MTSIIEKVAEWYTEGTLQDELEAFLEKYGHEVTLGDEQTHRNKEIYDLFTETMDRCLGVFCKKEGVSETELYKTCEAEYKVDETKHRIVSAILAAASYPAFIELVTDWREEQETS